MKKYILTLDQGTTSSRAILFDSIGHAVSKKQIEFTQYYPNPGWVEHNPYEIWESQKSAMMDVLSNVDINDVAAIGITNQRETTLLWDRNTGRPLYNAIVWQCRRTAAYCEDLKQKGLQQYVQDTTGLTIDAYFSASKIKWILENVPGAKQKAQNGDVCFGTIDSWLLWNLTAGKVHATDYTNASRTMLYDINNLCWDKFLLDQLDIPLSIMPEVKQTSGIFGHAIIDGFELPIASMVGDQQSALFGQTCFNEGEIKNTYGTGCFILCNTGSKKIVSENRLLSTIAWRINNETTYALEGSVFNAGSAIQWLRDEMKLINSSDECDIEAAKVKDCGGAYFVPAFTGLGAPYWDMYARGSLLGITRGTSKSHVIRSVLDSIAYQSFDIIKCMSIDLGDEVKGLYVDGGACKSNILMQFQSDLLDIPVYRPTNIESTAMGAAFLSGLQIGFWKTKEDLKQIREIDRVFTSQIDKVTRAILIEKWHRAVKCSMGWETPK